MRTDDTDGPPSLPSSFWIAGFVSLGLALGGGVWHITRPAPSGAPVSFPPLQIDADQLEAIQKDRNTAVGDISEDPRVRAFLETVRETNSLQFERGDKPTEGDAIDPEISASNARLQRKLEAQAGEVIPITTWQNFLAVGSPVFDACREGLEKIMTAVDSGELSSDAAMSGQVPAEYERYRQNCGPLYPVLVQRRLISEGGSWLSPQAPALFEIAQRYRFASIIERMYTPWRQLHPYERRIFLRWRIETPEAFSTKTRLRSIETAESWLEDYDTEFARGVVAWQNGNRRQALQHLKRARKNNPNDKRIARALRWAEDSIGQN